MSGNTALFQGGGIYASDWLTVTSSTVAIVGLGRMGSKYRYLPRLIVDMLKGCKLNWIWIRTGSACNDLDYQGPFSVICDMRTSVGERKHRIVSGGRNLCFGCAYSYKFYGSDCRFRVSLKNMPTTINLKAP